VGAVFALDVQVVGLEAFYHQAAFGSFLYNILNSHALDAMLGQGLSKRPSRLEAKGFLEGIKQAKVHLFPSLGLGESIRMEGRGIVGARLVVDQRGLHRVAFSAIFEGRGEGRSSMERFS
jgi:hypothetical protein